MKHQISITINEETLLNRLNKCFCSKPTKRISKHFSMTSINPLPLISIYKTERFKYYLFL